MSDLTLSRLIEAYKTDPVSTYKKLEWQTRVHYDGLLRRIERDYGTVLIADIKYRHLVEWHQKWMGYVNGVLPEGAREKVTVAHSMIGIVRTIVGFGATILEERECERLCGVLHKARFKMSKPREHFMTVEMVCAIRERAYADVLRSVALAQAFGFECAFRQGDVIGRWVPMSERGISDITWHGMKHLGGLRWENIDKNLVLTHLTNKKKKPVVKDLKLAPMVIEELTTEYPTLITGGGVNRDVLPSSGPVVIYEKKGRPYRAHQFRREWRKIARACGIDDKIFQMDTRASAVTEATGAGVPLEHVKFMAAHSNIATTEGYARDGAAKDAQAQQQRIAARLRKASGND